MLVIVVVVVVDILVEPDRHPVDTAGLQTGGSEFSTPSIADTKKGHEVTHRRSCCHVSHDPANRITFAGMVVANFTFSMAGEDEHRATTYTFYEFRP